MKMNDELNQLFSSLETGFIDSTIISNTDFVPKILVNDEHRNIKVLSSLQKELSDCDEFWISVAFLTMGGYASIINSLKELEQKGVNGKILVSQYLNFTQPEALKHLYKLKNIELKIINADNFHSKGYTFKKGDYYTLIIGSSNLTADALSVNKEWNLKVSAYSKSKIIDSFFQEFNKSFDKAIKVSDEYIAKYREIYNKRLQFEKIQNPKNSHQKLFKPNKMQELALKKLVSLRRNGISKAILISATGTGKTLLSAFDVKSISPKNFLFIVHRENIARASMNAYKKVLGQSINCGVYIGSDQNTSANYIFSTIQTLSRDNHLKKFKQNHFDYIVIDETHRSGAESYKKIINYFNPKFLLGMTATPNRTDGFDIFTHFDHNIAYEIGLKEALKERMLCPFHYYGVTDIYVNGNPLDDKADFNLLTKDERVERIIEKIKFYGTDDGTIRGLIFCSRKDEAKSLSKKFNEKGYRTICLTGENSEEDRKEAIRKIETDDTSEKIDYIFTVDIFNEGIDIPKINQVIMLRPTQSAIIFIQQLGRGLRRIEGKDYLTVIDFIGNYSNNYLIPIALYGDRSYNKDTIRKLIVSGNEMLPGTSTVNFDNVTKERIFNSIDNTNLQTKRDLKRDYELLKFKIGKIPMLVDFVKYNSRDPFAFINYSRSFYNFLRNINEIKKDIINDLQKELLEVFSKHINNSKRFEDSIILREVIHKSSITIDEIQKTIKKVLKVEIETDLIRSSIHNLNLCYNTINQNKKLITYNQKFRENIISFDRDKIRSTSFFKLQLENKYFRRFLLDSTYYSIRKFKRLYSKEDYYGGFVLYRKYSRKDVFRILCYDKQPVAQNVGGYLISSDHSNCPIFINYHKSEDISSTTKYEDKFLTNSTLEWYSKSNRTLKSKDVITIKNSEGLRLPLFIKKSNDEGKDFYYMGDVSPVQDSFKEEKMKKENGKTVPVVYLQFLLKVPVEKSLFNYITHNV